nr:reverse transcriptase domain-containing protein [Tanacetum cinerariifolium]
MTGLLFNKYKGDRVRGFLGEGHMERQCTQPKRLKNSAWFKEKMLLVQAQESSQLRWPIIEGYEDAIVVPAITADNFKLKHGLLTLIQNKQFFGHDKEDPHAHIRYFNKIASTLKFPNVLNTSIKLMLFPFSLEGATRIWLEKEPPQSIFTWDDLVSKFTNHVSPDVVELKDMVKALLLDKKGQNQSLDPVKAVEESCVTCGGAHSYRNCPATDGNVYRDNIQEFVSQASANRGKNFNQGPVYQPLVFQQSAYQAPAYQASAPQTQGVSKEDFLAYVKSNDAVIKNMQTQGQNMQNQLTNLTDLITKFVNSNSVSTLSLDMSFEISFADALILMPKFASTLKALIGNKEKLSEMARTLLNEHCSVVLLKKLPKKLGDSGKFLIPCDFPAFLNDDPSSPLSNQRNYLPEVCKELKICEAKSDKSSVDEPSVVELKALPPHLEYAFLEGDDKLPVIITKYLSVEEKTALITVLKSHKRAIAWKLSDIKGINPEFYTHKILMEEDFTPAVQHQRRVNPKIHDVIKQEGGFTAVENEDNELIPTLLVTGNQYYCFLDGFSGYLQIPIDPKDQEKTTFTCPYGTFAYRRMPFGLCNAPGMFQRNSFQSCLSYLEKMLKRCEDTNLCLNCENSHCMVKEGIGLGHKISNQGIEVEKAKVDVISKLPHPTTVKEAESNYTTTEKEMLAVVYAYEKFRSYLILNKSIEFTFVVVDTKGAENLAADNVSRLENPHQNVLDPKEINESFPLETLNLVSIRGNQNVMIKSSEGVYLARKPLISSRLATLDQLEAFRTAYKTPIGCTPYKLVYEKACHLPVELEHKAYWALRHANFDLKTTGNHRKIQINELNELCDQAYENSLIYKEKTKKDS